MQGKYVLNKMKNWDDTRYLEVFNQFINSLIETTLHEGISTLTLKLILVNTSTSVKICKTCFRNFVTLQYESQ
jgi:hypothetical protein